MNKFYFNQRNSFYDMDLGIVGSVSLPIIREDIENIEVENRREGSLTLKTGNYPDLKWSLNLKLLKTDNYKERIYQLNKWFTHIKDNRLYFEDYPQKCYKVKDIKFKDIDKQHRLFAIFSIDLICEPFMYLTREDSITVSNGMKVNNIGDLYAYPIFKLSLPNTKQNLSILFNDSEFQLRNVSGDIEVNTSRMAIKSSTNPTVKMIGDFPILKEGINTISWSGNINKFELIKNSVFLG